MSGFVYFIRPAGMPGPIKIGFSESPTGRLMQLGTWSPFPLELIATTPGTRELEANIHACFADDWSHREWFFPSRRLVEFVGKLGRGVPVEQAIDLSDKRGSRPRRGCEQPESDRLCGTYNKRIGGACRRAARKLGAGWKVREPAFVTEIMKTWRGRYQTYHTVYGSQPSPEALAQVEVFLRDPVGLGLVTKFSPRSAAAALEPAPC